MKNNNKKQKQTNKQTKKHKNKNKNKTATEYNEKFYPPFWTESNMEARD